jgi:ribosomal protein S18 acetylase RimI-like enzyme
MNDIIEFLNRNLLKNISLIYFQQNNPVIYLKRIGESVVLKGTSDQDWTFISSNRPEELEIILDSFKEDDRYFASIESWMLPYFQSRWKMEWSLKANRYYLPDEVVISSQADIQIRRLRLDEAEYIYRHSEYQTYTSVDYLKMRIERGLSAGIEESGQLEAWVLTHDDLAIGTLHVLESARRKGFATILTHYMISKLRKQRVIPFVQIVPENTASIRLAEKIGFRFDREVSWMAVRKTKEKNQINWQTAVGN